MCFKYKKHTLNIKTQVGKVSGQENMCHVISNQKKLGSL